MAGQAPLPAYLTLSCPVPPPSSLLPFLSWPPTSAQVSPCARVPGACGCLPQQGVGTLPSSASHRGDFSFKLSLIRETIGGCEEGKGKVVDCFKVCQNSGCTPEEPHGSGTRGRERQAGTGTLSAALSLTLSLPSTSGRVGTVEEQRAGYIVIFCLIMFHVWQVNCPGSQFPLLYS